MKITLCGSTRFKDVFEVMNKLLTLEGHIVYSVSFFGHAENMSDGDWKHKVDFVHKEKILESDAILVLDVGGYIGESTRNEIEYALREDKQIFYLSSWLRSFG